MAGSIDGQLSDCTYFKSTCNTNNVGFVQLEDKFSWMIRIIFIIILDIVVMNDDQDGNCRNKSGLSSFLAVRTADEWGSYHHHPHHHRHCHHCHHPHHHPYTHDNDQVNRPGSEAGRPGTMEAALRTPRTARTARPVSATSGR